MMPVQEFCQQENLLHHSFGQLMKTPLSKLNINPNHEAVVANWHAITLVNQEFACLGEVRRKEERPKDNKGV